MRLRFQPYALALVKPWRSTAGVVSHRHGWLVAAEDDGRTGWGDCCALPGQDESGEGAEALSVVGQSIADLSLDDSLQCLSGSLPARAAVESALLDLSAQRQGLPLRRLLSATAKDSVAVNGLGDLSDGLPPDFTVIKLKVGMRPPDEDLAALHRLVLPPGVRLRLDANRAWSFDHAARIIAALADLPIDCLEEPLAEPSLESLAALQRDCAFDLALDESLPHFNWDELLARPPVRRLILKPPMLGGLRSCYALAGQARAAGLSTVVTSSLDSAVGLAAAAHLAAAIDDGDLAHGLSTGSCFASDVAAFWPVRQGRLTLPETPGLGVVPQ